MQKEELVREISRKTGIHAYDVYLMLQAFGEVVVEQSVSHETIMIAGLGRVHFKKRKERIVKHQFERGGHKGKHFRMPSKWVAQFKFASNIQEAINEKTSIHTAPDTTAEKETPKLTFEEAKAAYLRIQSEKGQVPPG